MSDAPHGSMPNTAGPRGALDGAKADGRDTDDRVPRSSGEPQQIWRRDFPYTSEGEETVTRREFTRYLVLASGAFAAGNVVVAGWASARGVPEGKPSRIVALDDVPIGGSHLFRYPGEEDPAILVRIGDTDVVAWSQKCTHLGCVVYYAEEQQLLECPCHEGFFDVHTGRVVAGPPERPLPSITVEVRDGQVWATGYQVRGPLDRPR
jgi:Rieske Fe-S protein